ncbi:isopentenyl phosphate kinase [Patescibacteria group bacterium]|nr:isopentenyl phosphate kinase [Patescibacteria group bacterium]
MKKLLLVKFGGSLISVKTKTNRAKNGEINKLSGRIKKIQKNYSVIIFTGAGGFGHPVAAKYKNNLEEGLPEIKKAVKELNKIVVESLTNSGLKAQTVEPDKIARYENGSLLELSKEKIIELLEKNIIPVFHADLIRDKRLGVSVLSMDKFLIDVAVDFKKIGFSVDQIIFSGTTPGVVDGSGRTIQTITKDNFKRIETVFYKGKGIDVSGGMRYKVEQCLRLSGTGINCIITKGFPADLDSDSGSTVVG